MINMILVCIFLGGFVVLDALLTSKCRDTLNLNKSLTFALTCNIASYCKLFVEAHQEFKYISLYYFND